MSSRITGEPAAQEITGEPVAQEITGETVAQEITGGTVAQEITRKTVAQEITGETVAQEITGGTVAQEITGKTVAQEITGDTVAQEITGETVAQEITGKTVAQEITGETAAQEITGETAAQEITGKTAAQEITGETSAQEITGETSAQETVGEMAPVFGRRDHNTFRLSKMAWCPARRVLHSIFRWASQPKPPDMSLFQYLEGRGFTKTMLRKQFNKRRYATVLADTFGTGDSYDITLLQLSITLVRATVPDPLNPRLTTPGDALEDHLQVIKNFRNDVMHEAFGISDSEFMIQTERLREYLTKALKAAGHAFTVDRRTVDDIIRLMNDEVNDIRDDPLVEVDITSYQNQNFFAQLQQLLVDSGRPEVREVYSHYTSFSPLPFLHGVHLSLQASDVFTSMTVVECGLDSQTNQIDYEDIIHFIENKASNQRSEAKVAIMEGVAGVGKTNLLRFVMADWMSGNSNMKGLDNYHLLLYIDCRNPSVSSFSQLLKFLMPETSLKFRDADLVEVAQSLTLLVLVDGLDQLNDSSTTLLKEILDMKRTCSIAVICTTRPGTVLDFLMITPSDLKPLHLRLLGIPEESCVEFVTKYHEGLRKMGQSTQSTEGLTEYIENWQVPLKEELRLPLNLVFLSVLWALAPTEVNRATTATELRLKILEMTKEKLLERLKWNIKTQSFSIKDLRRKVELIFSKLCREAFVNLKEDFLTWSSIRSEELTRACLSLGLPPQEIIGAFLVQEETWTLGRLQSYVGFGYRGLQALYSALFVLHALKEKYQTLDTYGIINDIYFLIDHHSFCPSVGEDILNNIKRLPETHEVRSRLTISDVMEINPNDHMPLILGKYQGLLFHLAGLVSLDRGTLEEETAEELVMLLKHSGISESKQWLGILTREKCGPSISKHIETNIQLTGAIIRIEDLSVHAYAYLLQHAQPDTVYVDVKGNPNNIPLLEEMLKALSQYDCHVQIRMEHDFRHPQTCNESLDTALQRVLSRCKVSAFKGQLTGSAVRKIPETITELGLALSGNDPDLPPALSSLWSRVQLNKLELQVPAGTSLTSLPSQLPSISGEVRLWFPDVNLAHVEWVCHVSLSLQPSHRGYSSLCFPRSHLSHQDVTGLGRRLQQAGLRLAGKVSVSGCDFILE